MHCHCAGVRPPHIPFLQLSNGICQCSVLGSLALGSQTRHLLQAGLFRIPPRNMALASETAFKAASSSLAIKLQWKQQQFVFGSLGLRSACWASQQEPSIGDHKQHLKWMWCWAMLGLYSAHEWHWMVLYSSNACVDFSAVNHRSDIKLLSKAGICSTTKQPGSAWVSLWYQCLSQGIQIC